MRGKHASASPDSRKRSRTGIAIAAAAAALLGTTIANSASSGAPAVTVRSVQAADLQPVAMAVTHVPASGVRYTIARGDTLAGIAGKEYGQVKCWPGVYRANSAAIRNPGLIYPGRTIRIPGACDSRPVAYTTSVIHRSAVQAPVFSVSGSPEQIAQGLLAQAGEAGQYSCLYSLWNNESGWRVYAQNPSSGAYGIPQALPGSKMAAYGADWATNAATQIRWGLAYIRGSYGTPCGAWAHELAVGWY